MSSIYLHKKKFQETVNSLNESQRQSVLSNVNTLQILAGPGSGKTRVLTCRVAYYVIERRIKPEKIIVVTFTNKAANEMKIRLKELIGEDGCKSLLIGTFHAICCRLLHLHANLVNLDTNFVVADTATSKRILDTIRKDRSVKISDFTRKKMDIGAIWRLISSAKNRGETVDTYNMLYGKEFKTRDIAVLYTLYEIELKKFNLVDFDNLLLKTRDLLRKKNNILSNVKAILVDEYQDTNIVQYDLVKLMKLQDNSKELTIVGDPDQSIYGFRSAEPKNFGKMRKDFDGIRVINMEQNYRSTGKILKAALHVITQDTNRFNKSLRTSNPDGVPIFRISTRNEETQAEFVAQEIQKVIKESMGLINYKDIAVLMRMNFISRNFEEVFRQYKIPFTILGGDRFFDRVEVKDILSYLNFAYNPKDLISFNRIVNVPKRGIGAANLKKITDQNIEDNTDLLETIMNIGTSKSSLFGPAIRRKLLDLGSICSAMKDMMDKQESVAKIIRYLLEAIQYKDYLRQQYFDDHEARWNNIGELISVTRKTPTANDSSVVCVDSSDDEDDSLQSSYLTENKNDDDESGMTNIAEFLEYCYLCSNEKEMEEAEGGKVILGALHLTKVKL